MADLLSELKALPSYDISKDGIVDFYEGGGNVHGDHLNIDHVFALIKKYGWHDVSESPKVAGKYLVTVQTDDNCFTDQAFYDKFGKIPGWHKRGIIAWMPLPEPYIPDASQ